MQHATARPLGPEHAEFFERNGYLLVPGLLADEIEWIGSEFGEVVRAAGHRPPSEEGLRDLLYPMIDRRRRFCQLLDLPGIEDLCSLLLGADFNYLGSTGGYFGGDTAWHRDGRWTTPLRAKLYCNLSEVAAESGALRVVPGSHARGARFGLDAPDGTEVALAAVPGDVIVFDQTALHASFGGPPDRPAFTMTFGRRCRTAEELAELGEHIGGFADFGISRLYSDLMVATAPPARLRHLEQPRGLERRLRGPRATLSRYRFRRATRRARRLEGVAR